jgi:hypothetical protein
LLKYTSPWLALGVLFVTFGYPKIPFLGIPIAFIAIFFDWKNVIRICRTNVGKMQILTCFVFFIFCSLRVILGDFLYWDRNLIFCFTLSYKAFIGLYLAYVFIYLLDQRKNLVALFLFAQFLLMALSAFNESLYSFLLSFQTAEATTVFGEIFGMRSLGFGVIHNEGVVALMLMYALYAEFSGASRFLINGLGIFGYFSAFSSRLMLTLLPVWQIIKNTKLFIFVVVILAVVIQYLDISQGPLAQVFELYTYYNETGSIGSQSTTAISSMVYIPDAMQTWLIGDGQFFSADGFYQDTDIGFSRIIFFGGLIGLLFYFFLCCWPVILLKNKSKRMNITLLFFMLYVYFVSNVKGINIQSWAFIIYLHFSYRPNLRPVVNFINDLGDGYAK